jgi:murein L,D-transpeptidase YafK
MLLRAFKKERRLELWATSRRTAPLTHVTTYEICATSGTLGPKRREGDGQVPEGFYTLSDYVPASDYYLAMLVNYPNRSDEILGDKRNPGGEIMIHGRCNSIGCLAMTDERVQEIWVAATALRYAGGTVHVHIFPSRDMNRLLASGEHPEHRAFWENIREGFEDFERTKRMPRVRVDAQGRYHF